MHVRFAALAAPLLALALASCSTTKSQMSIPTLGEMAAGSADLPGQNIRLRAGDQLDIRLGGVPIEEINQVTGTYTIDTEGYVNMPQVGRIRANGLTQEQLQTDIQNAYVKKGVYSNPTITVTVPLTARFVNVGGEVRQPQRITYTPDLTILAAITAAGGFTEYASQQRVRLYRGMEVVNVDMHKIRKDPSQNILLEPGDTIEVMRSFF
jgi:polysaccharide export outer membrane protein